MSLLTICQGAMRSVGEFEVPATIVGSANQTAIQLLALAKRSLAFTAGLTSWQRLVREYTFATVNGTLSYSLPTDFDWILNDTYFDRTLARRVKGPVSANDWQALQAFPSSAALSSLYRIRGNLILLSPTPTSARTLAFEYVSTSQAETAAGAGIATWAADTDVARVPEIILQMDLEWRFLKSKGLPYQTELDEYVNALQRAIGRDGGKPRISMGRSALLDAVLTANVPEGNFG